MPHASFDVYHLSHRTMPTRDAALKPLWAEPCAPEEHSSESGSEKQGNLTTNSFNKKKKEKRKNRIEYLAMVFTKDRQFLRPHRESKRLGGKGCKANTGVKN